MRYCKSGWNRIFSNNIHAEQLVHKTEGPLDPEITLVVRSTMPVAHARMFAQQILDACDEVDRIDLRGVRVPVTKKTDQIPESPDPLLERYVNAMKVQYPENMKWIGYNPELMLANILEYWKNRSCAGWGRVRLLEDVIRRFQNTMSEILEESSVELPPTVKGETQ